MLTGSTGMSARREQIERQRQAELHKDVTPAHSAAQGQLAGMDEKCPNCGTWHDPASHEQNRRRLAQGLAEQSTRDREDRRRADLQHYASPEGYQAQPDLGKAGALSERQSGPDVYMPPGNMSAPPPNVPGFHPRERILVAEVGGQPDADSFCRPPFSAVEKGKKGKKWRILADLIMAGQDIPEADVPEDPTILPAGQPEVPPVDEMVGVPDEAAKSATNMAARRDPGENLPVHQDPAKFRSTAHSAPPPRSGQIPRSNVSRADLDRVNRKLPG